MIILSTQSPGTLCIVPVLARFKKFRHIGLFYSPPFTNNHIHFLIIVELASAVQTHPSVRAAFISVCDLLGLLVLSSSWNTPLDSSPISRHNFLTCCTLATSLLRICINGQWLSMADPCFGHKIGSRLQNLFAGRSFQYHYHCTSTYRVNSWLLRHLLPVTRTERDNPCLKRKWLTQCHGLGSHTC